MKRASVEPGAGGRESRATSGPWQAGQSGLVSGLGLQTPGAGAMGQGSPERRVRRLVVVGNVGVFRPAFSASTGRRVTQ